MPGRSRSRNNKKGGAVQAADYNHGTPFKKGGGKKSKSKSLNRKRSYSGTSLKVASFKELINQSAGGSHETRGPAHNKNHRGGGGKKTLKRRQTLTRRQKKSNKREGFVSTLNQMGGFIRDGSHQVFNMITGNNV
jgi:hypothetical protein